MHIPKHWTPEQALAVVEFLQSITAHLWQRYDDEILELIFPSEHEQTDAQDNETGDPGHDPRQEHFPW